MPLFTLTPSLWPVPPARSLPAHRWQWQKVSVPPRQRMLLLSSVSAGRLAAAEGSGGKPKISDIYWWLSLRVVAVGCREQIHGPEIFVLQAKSPFPFHRNPLAEAALKGLWLSLGSVIGEMGTVWGQINSWCKSTGCFILTARRTLSLFEKKSRKAAGLPNVAYFSSVRTCWKDGIFCELFPNSHAFFSLFERGRSWA